MQEVNGVGNLPDSKKVDAIGLLFSNDDLAEYPTYPSWDQDAYEIITSTDLDKSSGSTRNIPVLLSAGLSGPLAIKAGDMGRFNLVNVN